MNKWLVTGGAGFIGANFVHHAVRETDCHLVVLDALTYAGNLRSIADLIDEKRVTFVRGDICDVALVRDLFTAHRFGRVVHFAAESHVDRSILGPMPFVRTNVEGTANLLEAARSTWSDQHGDKLFLHVSTDEVYGSLGPDDAPFNEESPYRPSSPYAASKAASDQMARAWCHTYGLPVVVSNCSNNYGPLQFPEKLIPLMILNAMEERELPIYGDGGQVRDWLHVEDHCRALRVLLERGRPGETYVIGGQCERTNLEIVRRICQCVDQLLGREPGTSIGLLRHVADRPGHDRRYAIDPHKLRAETGWAPRHALEESLPDLVRWYFENRQWADEIRSGAYRNFYEALYGCR